MENQTNRIPALVGASLCSSAARRLHFQSQLRSAIETIILKWGIAEHIGAWSAHDFFESGIAGHIRACAISSEEFFKESAKNSGRGENECLYTYRARCAPG